MNWAGLWALIVPDKFIPGVDAPARCDFCSDFDVDTIYAANDTAIAFDGAGNLLVASKGAWAACKTCSEFIERDDAGGLAHHAAQALFRVVRDMNPPGSLAACIISVRTIHRRFWEARQSQGKGPGPEGWTQ